MSGLIRIVCSLFFLLFGGYSQLNAHAYRKAVSCTEISSARIAASGLFLPENQSFTLHLKSYSHRRLHKRFCTTDSDDKLDDEEEVASSKKQTLLPKYLIPAFYNLLIDVIPASSIHAYLPDKNVLSVTNQIFLRLGIIRI